MLVKQFYHSGCLTKILYFSHMTNTQKAGILLVAFGSTADSAQVAFTNIYNKIKHAFPESNIRWAFTSGFIRRSLQKKGEEVDSPIMALTKMVEEGYAKIAVQSMHVIPGKEYDTLKDTIESFKNLPYDSLEINLGPPLLNNHEDMEEVLKALDTCLPTFQPNEAIALMGHGTSHPSNIYYPALNYYLRDRHSNVYISTIEGYPTIKELIKELKSASVNKVFLMPFLSVLGDHVKKDMCGNHDSSWFNILTKAGFEVEVILTALGEIDEFVSIWIKHLKEVY